MKKYVFLVLLSVPVVAFGAPSVRVLGNANTASAASVKAEPAKATTGVTTSGTSGSTVSRIGTVRAKTTSGMVSNTKSSTGSESRFPVITPNHAYNSVVTPKPASGTTVVAAEVDTDAIKQEIMNEVSNNYYNQAEVNNIINTLKEEDDPRIDAIRLVNPNTKHTKDLPSDYVYMWIED